MLNDLNLGKVLFLDIETVPLEASYNDLDQDFKDLWQRKSRYFREQQGVEVEESYGRAGIYAEFGRVICISVGYFSFTNGREFRIKSFSAADEKDLLEEFADLLNTYFHRTDQLLCAHNGKEFDFPYLSRRMLINGIKLPFHLDLAGKKPWEVQHLDTMSLWKFGDFKHFTSIKLLAKIFDIPCPKDDIDGSDVARVYYEEKNLDRIVTYCKKDLVTVAQLILKFKGELLLEDHEIMEV